MRFFKNAFWLAASLPLAIALLSRSKRVSFFGRVVLITGGARGFGLEMAREFAKDGAKLILVARSEEELHLAKEEFEGRGVEVLTLQADLTVAEDILRVRDESVRVYGGVDVLVNNAGVIQVGPVDSMGLNDFEDAMTIHFWAPLRLILGFLPHMESRRDARIMNISSIGGKLAVPHMLPYTASKFALTGLSEGLRSELSRKGIKVTTVCPGLMRTGSVPNAKFKGNQEEEKNWFALGASLPIISINSEWAAIKAVDACRRGSAFLTFTPIAEIGVRAHDLAPNLTARLLPFMNWMLPKGSVGRESKTGREISSLASWQKPWIEEPAKRNNEIPNEKMVAS